MPVAIRSAAAADQPIISAMVRDARLNPFRLHWSGFLIAEDAGQVVGIGQVRPHGDGCRELSSLVVAPERQGQGIGSQMVEALLARESGAIYLFCREQLMGFYERFGFSLVEREKLPRVLARMHQLANIMSSVEALFSSHHTHIVAMRRELPTLSTLLINAPPAI
jgi:N-acetylglutamate synthase-like GNAT family acetyltransferase